MRLLGFDIRISKAAPLPMGYQTVEASRGWFPLVREGFAGAFQRGIVTSKEDVLTFAAVYACVTLKASDIAKLRIKLVQRDRHGVWTEVENPAYSPVLRKPNHYQTRIQFIESWMVSKFVHGNAYLLKGRNNRGGEGKGNVQALYPLDPQRVRVLVAPNGDVFYALSGDHLAGVETSVVVPASEIIHDVMVPLYHPLCGVSPLTACGLAATQGLRVQQQSTKFFENGVTPSGVISMPDDIDDDQARDIQKRWAEQFSGNNAGRVAVLGFGMKYDRVTMSAVDAQLIDQLKWTAENVCTAHHVPPYMVGVGAMPTYNNIEALNQQYYSQALQNPIESLELLLDEGLEMPTDVGTEVDLDGLLRMDTTSRASAAEKATKSGLSFNEVRQRFWDLGPVTGGESPMAQQQNFSLAALAKRDAQDDPFGTSTPAPPPAEPDDDDPEDETTKALYLKAAALTAAGWYQTCP